MNEIHELMSNCSQRYLRLSMILMFMMMNIHRFHNVFTFETKDILKDLHAIIDKLNKTLRNIQWHLVIKQLNHYGNSCCI